MYFETLLVQVEGPVARVTINRPKSLNALNTKVFQELSIFFSSVEKNKDIRVINICGSGDRAFVAGADIKEMTDMTANGAVRRSWKGMLLYDQIRRQPQPVIASINGFALGGGMLLAMACDIRVASGSSLFGYPEIRLGIFPGTGGTILIDRLIGPGTARAICITGENFSAERAFQLGIVTHLVSEEKLETETKRLSEMIAGYSPLALKELKGVLNDSLELTFEDARYRELEAYGRTFASADRAEGTRAFVEKRNPVFAGV